MVQHLPYRYDIYDDIIFKYFFDIILVFHFSFQRQPQKRPRENKIARKMFVITTTIIIKSKTTAETNRTEEIIRIIIIMEILIEEIVKETVEDIIDL